MNIHQFKKTFFTMRISESRFIKGNTVVWRILLYNSNALLLIFAIGPANTAIGIIGDGGGRGVGFREGQVKTKSFMLQYNSHCQSK